MTVENLGFLKAGMLLLQCLAGVSNEISGADEQFLNAVVLMSRCTV